MFKKYAKSWLVGMLLLGTLAGCDNTNPPEQAKPAEPDNTAKVNTPVNEQTPELAAAPIVMPPAPTTENQPSEVQSVPKTEVKTEVETATKVAPKVEPKITTKPEPKVETKEAQTPEVQQQTTTAKAAGSEGITSRETELKTTPQLDGKTLRTLPTSTPLLIFERLGGWYRVNVAKDQGWVRMLHVSRTAESGKAAAGAELVTVAAIATGREGVDNVAATTGIRGLNEENLATAAPDMARLQVLDSYGVSRAEAEKFALRNGLTSRTIAYLKEPMK
jgi:hypothetical protein